MGLVKMDEETPHNDRKSGYIMQPYYRNNAFVNREGTGRGLSDAYIPGGLISDVDDKPLDVGADIFSRGLCLPSDNKMTEQEQDKLIGIIRACFD